MKTEGTAEQDLNSREDIVMWNCRVPHPMSGMKADRISDATVGYSHWHEEKMERPVSYKG
jgi:hypothetical protein